MSRIGARMPLVLRKLLDTDLAIQSKDFEKHIFLTYHYLRLTMAATCGLLAVGIVVLGSWRHVVLQPTLSDYYYAENPPGYLRAVFVGLLAIFGAMLITYRGYTKFDNVLHNAAGLFALGVATFPTKCGCEKAPLCVATPWDYLHGTFAVLLFLAAIASIGHGGGKTFRDILAAPVRQTLCVWRIICGLVIAAGVAVHLLLLALPSVPGWLLFAESCAFLGFGAYWAVLTWCVSETNSARRAEREKRRKVRAALRPPQSIDEVVAPAPVDALAAKEEVDDMADIP